jgi:hypothetical protein
MTFKPKKLIPIGIFAGLLLIAVIIRMNPPEAPQRPAFDGPMMSVETVPVMPREYPIMLQSYGTVQPRTRSMLIAQVGGQIVEINENVRDGGFFEKGDVLGRIDPRDYEADVQIAEATLADARQALAEAIARSEQAREDWERLGNEGEPSELVLRIRGGESPGQIGRVSPDESQARPGADEHRRAVCRARDQEARRPRAGGLVQYAAGGDLCDRRRRNSSAHSQP